MAGTKQRRRPTDRWSLTTKQGDHIRALIGQAGMSERRLAGIVDIHDAQLSTLLSGKSVAPAPLLDAIAQVLGRSVDYLMHPERTQAEAASRPSSDGEGVNVEEMISQLVGEVVAGGV